MAEAALAQLCQTYWPPLYTFVRSRGYTAHDAQDLTQSFFAYLIEHKLYARVDREGEVPLLPPRLAEEPSRRRARPRASAQARRRPGFPAAE